VTITEAVFGPPRPDDSPAVVDLGTDTRTAPCAGCWPAGSGLATGSASPCRTALISS
jgi:hypothetical protein